MTRPDTVGEVQVQLLPTAQPLLIAPVSWAAAHHAVVHWHYSKVMPTPPLTCYGVWESERYVGAVVYGRGSGAAPFGGLGLNAYQCVELVRVALRAHVTPVSQIVAETVRQLRAQNPGLRALISYADPAHSHHGGIYQAMNWVYLGTTSPTKMFRNPRTGKVHHSRTVSASGLSKYYGQTRVVPRREGLVAVDVPGKHRYVLPLDKQVRRAVLKLAQPYPGPVDGTPTLEP